jgi:hypothetical protein
MYDYSSHATRENENDEDVGSEIEMFAVNSNKRVSFFMRVSCAVVRCGTVVGVHVLTNALHASTSFVAAARQRSFHCHRDNEASMKKQICQVTPPR